MGSRSACAAVATSGSWAGPASLGSCTAEAAAGAIGFHGLESVRDAWNNIPADLTHYQVAEHYSSRVRQMGRRGTGGLRRGAPRGHRRLRAADRRCCAGVAWRPVRRVAGDAATDHTRRSRRVDHPCASRDALRRPPRGGLGVGTHAGGSRAGQHQQAAAHRTGVRGADGLRRPVPRSRRGPPPGASKRKSSPSRCWRPSTACSPRPSWPHSAKRSRTPATPSICEGPPRMRCALPNRRGARQWNPGLNTDYAQFLQPKGAPCSFGRLPPD